MTRIAPADAPISGSRCASRVHDLEVAPRDPERAEVGDRGRRCRLRTPPRDTSCAAGGRSRPGRPGATPRGSCRARSRTADSRLNTCQRALETSPRASCSTSRRPRRVCGLKLIIRSQLSAGTIVTTAKHAPRRREAPICGRSARGSRAGSSAAGRPSTPTPRSPLRDPVAEEHHHRRRHRRVRNDLPDALPGRARAQNHQHATSIEADHREPVRVGAGREARRRAGSRGSACPSPCCRAPTAPRRRARA